MNNLKIFLCLTSIFIIIFSAYIISGICTLIQIHINLKQYRKMVNKFISWKFEAQKPHKDITFFDEPYSGFTLYERINTFRMFFPENNCVVWAYQYKPIMFAKNKQLLQQIINGSKAPERYYIK